MAPPAKHLPQLPLHPRAHHRIAHLAGHGEAQTGRAARRREDETHQGAHRDFLAPLLNPEEVGALPDARRTGKPLRGSGAGHDRAFPDYFLGAEAASRFRPFARRRLRTARPALVELRLRKPWVRFLRSLEGWYVRLGKVLLRPFGRRRP